MKYLSEEGIFNVKSNYLGIGVIKDAPSFLFNSFQDFYTSDTFKECYSYQGDYKFAAFGMVRKAYTQITEDDYKIFNLKTYCLNRNIFEEFLPMRDTNNSSFAAIRGERIIGLPSLIFKDENFPLWFYLPNRLEDTYIGLYNLKSDLENNKMKEIFYNYEISQRMERPVLGTDFLLHNGIALQYNSYDTITYSLNEKKEIVKIEENTPYQVTRDILLPELRILEVGNKQSLFHLFGPIHRASQTLTPTDEDRASLISLYSFNWQ